MGTRGVWRSGLCMVLSAGAGCTAVPVPPPADTVDAAPAVAAVEAPVAVPETGGRARLLRPVQLLNRPVPPARVVARLDKGMSVTVDALRAEGSDGWRHVLAGDHQGWVPALALTASPP